jgi:hypothetical protein
MSTPLSQPRSRVPRIAEAAVERARLSVVPRTAQRAPKVPFVTLVSLLLVGGIAGLLLFNTNMQQSSFVASSMELKAAELAGKEESLRMELDRLRDPQTVAAKAKKLGMVPADSPAFLRLSDGKVLGRPTVAEPSDGFRIAPPPPVKPESLRPRTVIAEVPKAERRANERADAARRSTGRRDSARRAGNRRDTTAGSDPASRDRAAGRRTTGRDRNGADRSGRAR